jgi:deoxyribose-phosphate aldolase
LSIPSQNTLVELIAERSPAILQAHSSTLRIEPVDVSVAQLAATIDHTLLKPEATSDQIRQLCTEATKHGFASVCVNPTWVARCAQLLAGAHSVVCTVVGFPLGATLSAVKAHEAAEVIRLGAREVDMVINIGLLKDAEYAALYADIAAVVDVAHSTGAIVKVIIESCLLSEQEKIAAALLTQAAGADFVKTSTGFSSGGATVADVRLLRLAVGPAMGVKAAGGVRTAEDALQMIGAGATRLGASAGVRIVESLQGLATGSATSNDRRAMATNVAEKETY